MQYEITDWKIPNDMLKAVAGLDTMVAIMAKRASTPDLYLYDSDYRKIVRLAKLNLPDTATFDGITFRGIPVRNGGTKQAKRPAPKYNPERIKLK